MSSFPVVAHIALFAVLSLFAATDAFHCDGSICICLDSQCHTNCTEGFCRRKHFIVPKEVDHCSFDCLGADSCSDSNFYIASHEFRIECAGHSSCRNTTIRCGVEDDPENGMHRCAISAAESSMDSSYILCDRTVGDCVIESTASSAAAHAVPAISDTEIECAIDDGLCRLNCDGRCLSTQYRCSAPSEDQCRCSNCSNVEVVRFGSPGNNGSGSGEDTPSPTDNVSDGMVAPSTTTTAAATLAAGGVSYFDLTDSNVSNLEVLYYIILGAAASLLLCLCVCCVLIVVVRSTVRRNKRRLSRSSTRSTSQRSAPSLNRRGGAAPMVLVTPSTTKRHRVLRGVTDSSKSSPESSEYDAFGADSRSDSALERTLCGGGPFQNVRRSGDQRGDYALNAPAVNESESEEMDLDDRWPDDGLHDVGGRRVQRLRCDTIGARHRLKQRMRCDSDSVRNGSSDVAKDSDDDLFSFSETNDPLQLHIKVTAATTSQQNEQQPAKRASAATTESSSADLAVRVDSKGADSGAVPGPSASASPSNPDPAEGTEPVIRALDRECSGDSESELNLFAQSESFFAPPLRPRDQRRQPPMDEMVAHFTAIQTASTSPDLVAMQRQFEYLEHQNKALNERIDRMQSMRRRVGRSSSTVPTLPVIASSAATTTAVAVDRERACVPPIESIDGVMESMEQTAASQFASTASVNTLASSATSCSHSASSSTMSSWSNASASSSSSCSSSDSGSTEIDGSSADSASSTESGSSSCSHSLCFENAQRARPSQRETAGDTAASSSCSCSASSCDSETESESGSECTASNESSRSAADSDDGAVPKGGHSRTMVIHHRFGRDLFEDHSVASSADPSIACTATTDSDFAPSPRTNGKPHRHHLAATKGAAHRSRRQTTESALTPTVNSPSTADLAEHGRFSTFIVHDAADCAV